MKLCPRCGAKQIRRSRRKGWSERFALSLVRVMPYRCVRCNWRFRTFSPSWDEQFIATGTPNIAQQPQPQPAPETDAKPSGSSYFSYEDAQQMRLERLAIRVPEFPGEVGFEEHETAAAAEGTAAAAESGMVDVLSARAADGTGPKDAAELVASLTRETDIRSRPEILPSAQPDSTDFDGSGDLAIIELEEAEEPVLLVPAEAASNEVPLQVVEVGEELSSDFEAAAVDGPPATTAMSAAEIPAEPVKSREESPAKPVAEEYFEEIALDDLTAAPSDAMEAQARTIAPTEVPAFPSSDILQDVPGQTATPEAHEKAIAENVAAHASVDFEFYTEEEPQPQGDQPCDVQPVQLEVHAIVESAPSTSDFTTSAGTAERQSESRVPLERAELKGIDASRECKKAEPSRTSEEEAAISELSLTELEEITAEMMDETALATIEEIEEAINLAPAIVRQAEKIDAPPDDANLEVALTAELEEFIMAEPAPLETVVSEVPAPKLLLRPKVFVPPAPKLFKLRLPANPPAVRELRSLVRTPDFSPIDWTVLGNDRETAVLRPHLRSARRDSSPMESQLPDWAKRLTPPQATPSRPGHNVNSSNR